MNYMEHLKKLYDGLPYAHWITNILKFGKVSFRGETETKMTSRDCEISIAVANKNMGIFKDNDGLFKHREKGTSSNQDAH